MEYSDFTLSKVQQDFGLTIVHIDITEYYIQEVSKILGILMHAIVPLLSTTPIA